MAKILLPSVFLDTPLTTTSSSRQPRLFSPPNSPPAKARKLNNSHVSQASRALQNLLMGSSRPTLSVTTTHVYEVRSSSRNHLVSPVEATPRSASLPTPPMAYAPLPPKLRMPNNEGIVGRRMAAKRRRDEDDEDESDSQQQAPSTPKRARIAPEQLPLGLDRSDFHALSSPPAETDAEWSAQDDRLLVEIVLEKVNLTKDQWAECARALGKPDKSAISRRWRNIIAGGQVDVKRRRLARA